MGVGDDWGRWCDVGDLRWRYLDLGCLDRLHVGVGHDWGRWCDVGDLGLGQRIDGRRCGHWLHRCADDAGNVGFVTLLVRAGPAIVTDRFGCRIFGDAERRRDCFERRYRRLRFDRLPAANL